MSAVVRDGCASPPRLHPHLAWPVLAGGTIRDTVCLQVHVTKGHLFPLDAKLEHTACGVVEMGRTVT